MRKSNPFIPHSNCKGRVPISVSARFSTLLANIALTASQRSDGQTKHKGVRSCLNAHYYGSNSEYSNSMLIGSWGKSTDIRPPRDIDVLFALPWSVYTRIDSNAFSTNKQSALLQEVKRVLQTTYTTTRMRADGQVVVVPFLTYSVDVVPAFQLSAGDYWICDTNSGGSYKTSDPVAEQNKVTNSNNVTKGNTRDLIRMAKCWQGNCNVPLKSFCIELLAMDFLESWQHAGCSTVYYDWMVRDFFGYLETKVNGYVFVPGTYKLVYLGDSWHSRAVSAHNRANNACAYESAIEDFNAGWEWRKIFGDFVPLTT